MQLGHEPAEQLRPPTLRLVLRRRGELQDLRGRHRPAEPPLRQPRVPQHADDLPVHLEHAELLRRGPRGEVARLRVAEREHDHRRDLVALGLVDAAVGGVHPCPPIVRGPTPIIAAAADTAPLCFEPPRLIVHRLAAPDRHRHGINSSMHCRRDLTASAAPSPRIPTGFRGEPIPASRARLDSPPDARRREGHQSQRRRMRRPRNCPWQASTNGPRRSPATSWQSTGLVVMARNGDATRAPPQVVFCEVTSPTVSQGLAPWVRSHATSPGPPSRYGASMAMVLPVWPTGSDGSPCPSGTAAGTRRL
jgi:hypothetical protein